MNGSYFTLTGTENLKRIFDQFPEMAYRQPVMAAFRKAAQLVKRAMQQELPANLKPMKKILKIEMGKGKSMTLSVGFFRGNGVYVNQRGRRWDPYQLVYWHNYGTLANRAAGHSFKTPRRGISAGLPGGIRSGLFVERAIDISMPDAERVFLKYVEEEIMKFLNKEAAA
jgi:hypothetical protein